MGTIDTQYLRKSGSSPHSFITSYRLSIKVNYQTSGSHTTPYTPNAIDSAMAPSWLQVLFLLASVLPSTFALLDRDTLTSRSIANGVALRILPMGDSITFGFQSTDGNGYRQQLLDLLPDNPTTYIGSQHSGNMTNNNNEGYSGRMIDEIASDVAASGSYAMRPNLVLIMAGTNDINEDNLTATAPDRLSALIDQVRDACPDAAILVGEITPIANDDAEARAVVFDAAIPGIAASKFHVAAVNMSSFVPETDLVDGLHPDDSGYDLMAAAWLQGIQDAAAQGWITPPVNVNSAATPTNSTAPAPSVNITAGTNSTALSFSTTTNISPAATNTSVTSTSTTTMQVSVITSIAKPATTTSVSTSSAMSLHCSWVSTTALGLGLVVLMLQI